MKNNTWDEIFSVKMNLLSSKSPFFITEIGVIRNLFSLLVVSTTFSLLSRTKKQKQEK